MKRFFLSIVLLAIAVPTVFAQQTYVPTAANLEQRENFRDAGFGIFLHWGIYSMFSQGEWYLNDGNLDYKEYGQAAAGFYPSKFDAAAWVKAFKDAGAGYICITSRHHDGFSMFDTQYSDFSIMKASPFKRDILKELSDECHKQGLRFHVYYSLIDWTRDDYYPLGRTGRGVGRRTHGDYSTYFEFMKNQCAEIVTKYNADCVWFDGEWDQTQTNPNFNWRFPELYESIHALNDACLIANNHHHSPYEHEDIQCFERDVPGENQAGYSAGQEVSTKLPLETCQTMNTAWGYKISDKRYKPLSEIVQLIVRTAGRDANLLLNIGPTASGELPPMSLQRLSELGEWMNKYGETVKGGVRGGIIKPQTWGVTTQKDKTLYLHILDLAQDNLTITLPAGTKIKAVNVYDTKAPVTFKQVVDGVYYLKLAEVPATKRVPDYIVEVTLK
ncbi:MAG: alpha-L-fucosidase [Bacteroidales bacterium]|nr:alpha-L-fucosidase [Bacteroidales bacterium]